MSRRLAASLLLLALLAVTASATATAPASPYEDRQLQDKRSIVPSDDAHLEEAATRLLAAEGVALAAIWAAAKKDTPLVAQTLEAAEPSGGGVAMATQGDDQSSSSGGGGASGGGEHGKEEGGGKEGEKQQGKSCLTKEECHKKKMLCGKGCTLSAHSKCAAKCTRSCVPTC